MIGQRIFMRRLGLLLVVSMPSLATAQRAPAPAAAPEPEDGNADEPDIIVTGQRNLPGAVIGDIPPDQQLGPADIRSYGVSTVADLLAELSPQTTSGRGSGGAPVVLLNGRRISSFAEIRDIPTEAIQRVDILPEEVALKYGYRADQKVVNVVLRRRFRAVTTEASDRLATEGGRNTPQGTIDLLGIARDKRMNLHLDYTSSSALTEGERDIVDPNPYRSLLGSSSNFSANAVYAQPISGKVQATINGRIEATDSTNLNGLPAGVLDGSGYLPLAQRGSSIAAHLGTTLNGELGTWRWSVTGNYDRSDTQTFTETGVDATAANRAYAHQATGGVDALFNGTLFALPAGPVSTSVKLGAQTADFSSRSYRGSTLTPGDVARDTVNGQVNVDLPIANRSKDVLGLLGTLSANFNLAEDHLSDFGTLTTLGYGANWAPVEGIRLIASVTDSEEAPSAQQLGNPSIVRPNVRIFDYIQGTTATVTAISGGNPNLVADNAHVTKLGLTLKPWTKRDINLTANYVSARTDDPIAAFPTPTAAIEAAFPERFTRDGGGALLRVDQRPINFARSERSELRWGINVSAPIKSKVQKQLEAYRAGTGPNPFEGLAPPGGFGGRREGGDGAPRGPGGGGGFRGGGGGGFGGRGQGGGRVQFALYHTWHFTDRVLVAQGGPLLDLLRGDAIGANGGQPRHEIEAQAGYSNNGIGVRVSADYASGTRVNGGTAAAPETLNFSGLATANLRLFADLGQRLDLVKAHPWLRGARVTLSVDNLLNSRQRVTDANGATPIGFQPDYLDPLGRTVRLSVRKLFF